MVRAKKSVENMTGYHVPMYEKNWDIKIDSNENNYGPSPKVIHALRECNYKNISFYPFYGELSKKIADFYGYNINNIKVTNGADEAIQGIIQTYMEADEVLITLDVSFDMPVIYSQIAGAQVIKVPFQERWIFPICDFLKELDNDKIKIIYLASPNNPTGSIISESDLNKIIEKAQNKIIIIDETYANYSDTTFKDYAKKYNNVFIVRSFSKDFALAGMRLGCVISAEENIVNLKKVISPFSVNTYAVIAGINALEDAGYFYSVKEEVTQSKSELKNFFEQLGAYVYESKANFLLVDFKNKAQFVYNILKNQNISVKLFKNGSLLENHLRVTIPTRYGVEKIKNALKLKPMLVFDMDGVLINASKSYRVAVEKTFEKFSNMKVNPNEIQAAKNQGGLNNDWDLTQYLLKKYGFDVPYDEIVDTFNKFYWDDGKGLINNEEPLFYKRLFEDLSKDYNLAVFTGRLKYEAMFALERFDMLNMFCSIITTDDIGADKAKPNPFGLNLTRKNTIAEKYYYFGDTPDDITAAKDAGYIEIGVLPPQDKSEYLVQVLKNRGAKYVLRSVNDIKDVLEIKNERV